MLAAALIDRLFHRAVIVGIDGPSYRMRSHQARADALHETTTQYAGSATTATVRTSRSGEC